MATEEAPEVTSVTSSVLLDRVGEQERGCEGHLSALD